MLQKTNRLTKRKEFGYIYRNGKKVSSGTLNLVYHPTKLACARFGFVVSKKIGKAYVRNKIKRQLSEIVRNNIALFHPKTNYIFVAKPDIVNQTFLQKHATVLELLSKTSNTQKGE